MRKPRKSLSWVPPTVVMALAASVAIAAKPAEQHCEVVWPSSAPRGVIVFLHGVSTDPLVEEGEGIEALTTMAARHGYVSVVPLAPRRCRKNTAHCWLLLDVGRELATVDAAVDAVTRTLEAPFERHIVGFSNGGFLLGAALEQQLLDDYDRVGIIAGGPVGPRRTPSMDVPPVFLEVGRADRLQRPSMLELRNRLRLRAPNGAVHFREVNGGHAFTAERARAFLSWFWNLSDSASTAASTAAARPADATVSPAASSSAGL